MSDRSYDPEALERLGRVTCGFLADDYQELVRLAYIAGGSRDEAFAAPLAGSWDRSFTVFYNCIYETAANLQALGGALLDIVERNLDDEDAIAAAITNAQDQVYGEGYTRVEEYRDSDEQPQQAPGSRTLDDNPYEDQLSGRNLGDPEPL